MSSSLELGERVRRIQDTIDAPQADQLLVNRICAFSKHSPETARIFAENIRDEPIAITTLVGIACETGEVAPLYDAVAMAQSESAIKDPKKRSQKLGFIVRHAVKFDQDLGLEITRQVEDPNIRAQLLLTFAVESDTNDEKKQFLQEIEHSLIETEGGEASAPSDKLYGQFLWMCSSLDYQRGLRSCNRRLILKDSGRQLNRTTAEKLHTQKQGFVADCIIDSYEKGRYQDLLPIADAVSDFYAWCADKGTTPINYYDYRTSLPLELSHSSQHFYGRPATDFNITQEGLRIAETFTHHDNIGAGIKLLQGIRSMINNNIKDLRSMKFRAHMPTHS